MEEDKLFEAYQKVINESDKDKLDKNMDSVSSNLDKIWKTVRTKYPETWKVIAKDMQKIEGLLNDVWTYIYKNTD